MTFEDYYAKQSGGGVYEGPLWQDGGAIKGFRGRDLQYGTGFGAFGRILFRWAKPLLLESAKYLGRQGLKAGVNIGNDVLAGEDIKGSVSNRLKETGTQIASDAAEVVKKKLKGRGKMNKMARKRRSRRINKKPVIRRKQTVRRRRSRRVRVKKALRDIFA